MARSDPPAAAPLARGLRRINAGPNLYYPSRPFVVTVLDADGEELAVPAHLENLETYAAFKDHCRTAARDWCIIELELLMGPEERESAWRELLARRLYELWLWERAAASN